MPENLILYHCKTCGGQLESNGEFLWTCKSCGNTYKDTSVKQEAEELLSKLIEHDKIERVSNIRKNIYSAIKEKYINSEKVCSLCSALLNLLPDDFMANFYYKANSGTPEEIIEAIRNIDEVKYREYIADIVEHISTALRTDYVLPLQNLIERTFGQNDLVTFGRLSSLLSKEAEKTDNGFYATNIKRNVFVAYSSKDMKKVEELVECLESNHLTCFVAARNLRHGRGSVENYKDALEEAMRNCDSFVLVSSMNSRSIDCDAFSVEMKYIKQLDIENAPHEYRQNYAEMPHIYKKPRCEYMIEKSNRYNAADATVKEFFEGYEYVFTPEDVAERLLKSGHEITPPPIKQAPLSPPQPEPAFTAEPAKQKNPLIKRIRDMLADGEFTKADEYCERLLDEDVENAELHLFKLMIELGVREEEGLSKLNRSFVNSTNYKKLIRYASPEEKKKINSYLNQVNENIHLENLEKAYIAAKRKMNSSVASHQFFAASEAFSKLEDYKDSAELAKLCQDKGFALRDEEIKAAKNAEESKKKDLEKKYSSAKKLMRSSYIPDVQEAINIFNSIRDYSDSAALSATALKKLTTLEKKKNKKETRKKKFKFAIRASLITLVVALVFVGISIYLGTLGEKEMSSIALMGAIGLAGLGILLTVAFLFSKNPSAWSFFGLYFVIILTIASLAGDYIETNITKTPENDTLIYSRYNDGYQVQVRSGTEVSYEFTVPEEYNGKKVISIYNDAFEYQKKLEEITIPTSVTYIGKRAFLECSSLERINFSGTLKEWQSIEKGADWNAGCPLITVICSDAKYVENNLLFDEYDEGYVVSKLDNINNYREIVIPSTYRGREVFAIGNLSFSYQSVETVHIPSTVTIIDSDAFAGCENLTTVIYGGTKAELDQIEIFDYCFDQGKIITFICTDQTIEYEFEW